MNEKALSTLEYDKIIEMLTSYASSSLGKQRCENLLPSKSIGEIEHQQQQTADALTRLFQKGNISFGSVKDLRASLKRLEIGSSLNIIELLTGIKFTASRELALKIFAVILCILKTHVHRHLQLHH